MRAFTHLFGGILAGMIGYKLGGINLFYMAVIASMIPDLDLPFSKLGKKPFWLTPLLEHRGITHSLTFALLAIIVIALFWGTLPAFAFFLGLLSHILLDALNPKGVMLFWPIRLKLRGHVKYAWYNDLMLSGLMLVATGTIWIIW